MIEKLTKHTINEDSCTICFDDKACMEVLPCNHNGFCFKCSAQLESCPMCRGPIFQLVNLNEEYEESLAAAVPHVVFAARRSSHSDSKY